MPTSKSALPSRCALLVAIEMRRRDSGFLQLTLGRQGYPWASRPGQIRPARSRCELTYGSCRDHWVTIKEVHHDAPPFLRGRPGLRLSCGGCRAGSAGEAPAKAISKSAKRTTRTPARVTTRNGKEPAKRRLRVVFGAQPKTAAPTSAGVTATRPGKADETEKDISSSTKELSRGLKPQRGAKNALVHSDYGNAPRNLERLRR